MAFYWFLTQEKNLSILVLWCSHGNKNEKQNLGLTLNILYVIHKGLNSGSWAKPTSSGFSKKFFQSQIGHQCFKVGYFSRRHCPLAVTDSITLCCIPPIVLCLRHVHHSCTLSGLKHIWVCKFLQHVKSETKCLRFPLLLRQ